MVHAVQKLRKKSFKSAEFEKFVQLVERGQAKCGFYVTVSILDFVFLKHASTAIIFIL
jgi:restriction endonuclease Mrr